jgi:hypothetical protein
MLTFTRDGNRILVANEGEPNSYGQPGSHDPEGSVSVINVKTGTVQTAGFGAFDAAALRSQGVRIFGPGATAAQDLEPEYIAVAPDGKTAFVTLQENNALGIVDLADPAGPKIVGVKSLGFKDYTGKPGSFQLDPSDQNGKGTLASKPGLYGLYQSDAIASFTLNGETFLVTADEGDTREWVGIVPDNEEERRLGGPAGDPFRRLNVTELPGVTGGTPADATAYAFGGRGFTIRTSDGTIVFDSGDFIERLLAEKYLELLDDGRSDNKGPEPEDVKIARVDHRLIMFLGLERANRSSEGTILAFDLTDFMPGLNGIAPQFLGLIRSTSLRSPEGLAVFSEGGRTFLAVADEESRKTVLFEVSAIPEPAALGLLALGVGAVAFRRRRA